MTLAGERALAGVVLAGGASTRMGRDKALLDLGGRRLVDVTVEVLRQCCDTVAVAVGARPIAGLDVPVIDDAEGEGPLAGIVASLRWASTPLVAVVAVDMPLASAAVLRRLAAAHHGEPAVVPHAGGVVQPLHAVYASNAAGAYARLLAGGERSPRAALAALGGLVVDASVYDPDGTAGRFWTNVNSPEDLQRLARPPAAG